MKYYQYNKENSGLYNKYKEVFQELDMISILTNIEVKYVFLQSKIKRETLLIRIIDKEMESFEITDYSDCGFIQISIPPEKAEQIKNMKPKKKQGLSNFYLNVPLHLFESFFSNLYLGYDYKKAI